MGFLSWFFTKPEPQPETEYQQLAFQLEACLQQERTPENIDRMNECQRSLADLAQEAITTPHFFTPERITEISFMITAAGSYLKNTPYEASALQRPEEFRIRVEKGKEAADAIFAAQMQDMFHREYV